MGKAMTGSQVWQDGQGKGCGCLVSRPHHSGDGSWISTQRAPVPAPPPSLTHPLGTHLELPSPLGRARGWALRPQGRIGPGPGQVGDRHPGDVQQPGLRGAGLGLGVQPSPRAHARPRAQRPPPLACSWCSMPMLTVLTKMAIMMPRLKYLLSTMPRSLARVSRHTSPHSRAAPSACSSSSSFSRPEEVPSSLLRAPSPSTSSESPPEPPEPEPSWPESVLPGPEGRRFPSCWQRGQLAGSEASMAEMGCTGVWGIGSRGLCRGHSSAKQTQGRVGASGYTGLRGSEGAGPAHPRGQANPGTHVCFKFLWLRFCLGEEVEWLVVPGGLALPPWARLAPVTSEGRGEGSTVDVLACLEQCLGHVCLSPVLATSSPGLRPSPPTVLLAHIGLGEMAEKEFLKELLKGSA